MLHEKLIKVDDNDIKYFNTRTNLLKGLHLPQDENLGSINFSMYIFVDMCL